MTLRLLAALGGTDCEHIGAGWLAQPANAVSSLAYVAAGGWLLHRAAGRHLDRLLLLGAGTALAAAGLASVAYHGPQPTWAGLAHDWSIAGLAVAFIGLPVWRVAQASRLRAVVEARWWWAAGACWAVALAAYVAGRTGSRLCRPESLWQPHAAWHVLSALGLGVAAFALAHLRRAEERSERTRRLGGSPQ